MDILDIKRRAKGLVSRAKAENVRFPTIWDEKRLQVECGAMLLTKRMDDGMYDEESALKQLKESYGIDEKPPKSTNLKQSVGKKRKVASRYNEGADLEDDSGKEEKRHKSVAKVLANQTVADAIQEIGVIYFKNGDTNKGGVYSRAAAAIRHCDKAMSDFETEKQMVKSIKGVGKKIASYIFEKLETGAITKLEELRAGIA